MDNLATGLQQGCSKLVTLVWDVRKPTLVKSYVCIFVSMSVKAVHLEAVTDLTTEGFISALEIHCQEGSFSCYF